MYRLSQQAIGALIVDINRQIADIERRTADMDRLANEVISVTNEWVALGKILSQGELGAPAWEAIVEQITNMMNETRMRLHRHADNGKTVRNLERSLGKNDRLDKTIIRFELEQHHQWAERLTEELKQLTSWRDEMSVPSSLSSLRYRS
ncbi:hypothetical protein CcaCcLH18_03518 [Colletotrichum camelliae]|nr:hypothetical protein CcaCcLH18_03518 [Colletotrichum camelliae]